MESSLDYKNVKQFIDKINSIYSITKQYTISLRKSQIRLPDDFSQPLLFQYIEYLMTQTNVKVNKLQELS